MLRSRSVSQALPAATTMRIAPMALVATSAGVERVPGGAEQCLVRVPTGFPDEAIADAIMLTGNGLY